MSLEILHKDFYVSITEIEQGMNDLMPKGSLSQSQSKHLLIYGLRDKEKPTF